MKKLLSTIIFTGVTGVMFAQAPLVKISDIQQRSTADLGNCRDTANFIGDTVRVRGIVTVPGTQFISSSGNASVNLLDTSGPAPFNTIMLYNPSSNTINQPVKDLLAGFTIEVTGTVSEFSGETQFQPLPGNSITVLGTSTYAAKPISVGELNDAGQLNILTTGEAHEGGFVEINNVTVIAVSPFTSGGLSRVTFTVADANGNRVVIGDRYHAQRGATGVPSGQNYPAGTFVAPAVGDVFSSIKGIVVHSKNNCTGFTGRGYEIHPFDASHYVVGAKVPVFTNVTRTPEFPTSSQSVVISADIQDPDGSITSAQLHYAASDTATVYTTVAMTNAGSVYSATIPAMAEGTFVKYYMTATDNASNGATTINSNTAYVVRDNGPTIRDIQYTPFSTGNSIYNGMTLTTTGVVTASAEASNLGYVFIQQEGQTEWAGLMLTGNAALSTLVVGDKVTVTGKIMESFGLTRMEAISAVTKTGTGVITPVVISDPNMFTKFSVAINEKYENMLVTVDAIPGEKLFVVDTHADAAPGATTPNFGDYRIGYDVAKPDSGLRILAGRQNSTTFSSLNVAYVNDPQWATVDGFMNVTPIIVENSTNFESVTGIIYYGFSNMKLLPRNNADFQGIVVCAITLSATSTDVPFNQGTGSIDLTVSGATAPINYTWSNGATTEDVSGLVAGTYSVTVVDSIGCSETLTKEIMPFNCAIAISSVKLMFHQLVEQDQLM